ncbi:NADAR [uncultured Caudovirales phage]|uniref:NADAR n=1 Tax=uncultured Caudovirales phage TaxID=2100421 RepID=A0A6J5RHQ9_9CAUD|nr:NADAR [uncultured Caudovirales phage]
MTIKFYKSESPYGYLNNFDLHPISIYGDTWKTVEHAYQAQKCVDTIDYLQIMNAETPRIARNLGQEVNIRDDWDDVKYHIMSDCVFAKFTQHKDLQDLLLSTGDEEIIENSPIDFYWGCGKDGTGKNMLGKILMQVRTIIRNNKKNEIKK